MLKTNLEGNLTLEGVQRGQSGTYGCRVEDYDAAEDAVLSKTAELRVACERPGRTGLGALAPAASSPSPRSPAANPFSPFLWPFLVRMVPSAPRCLLQPPPVSHTRQPESQRQLTPKHKPDCPLLQTCHGSPVLLGEGPHDVSRPSRPTWLASPVADTFPHPGIPLIPAKLLSSCLGPLPCFLLSISSQVSKVPVFWKTFLVCLHPSPGRWLCPSLALLLPPLLGLDPVTGLRETVVNKTGQPPPSQSSQPSWRDRW